MAVKFAVEDLFPWPEIQLPSRYRNDHLSPHHLSLHVGIGIVFTGTVVLVLCSRRVRGELLQPNLVIMQQPILRIVYEHRCSYVHGIHQTESLLNPTLLHKLFDRVRYIHETATIWHFEPELFSEAFHDLDMPQYGDLWQTKMVSRIAQLSTRMFRQRFIYHRPRSVQRMPRPAETILPSSPPT